MRQEQERLGDRVRFKRLELGYTQAKLGGKCDLSERSVARIETSVIQPPKEDVFRLAEALGVTEGFLRWGLSHAEMETNSWIDDHAEQWQLTSEEETSLKEMVSNSIKQRKNARLPLSPSDIESLLIILRG